MKGKIIKVDLERKFGFIESVDKQRVHFRLMVVQRPTRWEDLHPGMEVDFEITNGQQGPTAAWVKPAVEVQPQPGRSAERITEQAGRVSGEDWPPSRGYRFLNPYNFARYFPKEPKEASGGLGRSKPLPHNQLAPGTLSGKISCTLKAVTELFVSSGKALNPGESHPEFEFFKIGGKKVIPGSTLRGMTRTIYETVTNSCLSTITDERLSYRLEPHLVGFLVPARVEGKSGAFSLRLLTGTAQLQIESKPTELYPASVRQYRPIRSTSKNPRAVPPSIVPLKVIGVKAFASEQHGVECWAALERLTFPPSWRAAGLFANQSAANAWIAKAQSGTKIYRGYLCATNQNIDNKASERFFFEASKPQILPLHPDVCRNYEDLIRDYQERHAKEVDKWKKAGCDPRDVRTVTNNRKEAGFSRFILNREERRLRGGELVYALLSGRWPNARVEFIAPVSIPRVAYDHTIAELLPGVLRPCREVEALCPACRTFGWVSPKKGKSEQGEWKGYRGRVRFSDAFLQGDPSPARPMRLAILGAPKPTTARFYLFGSDYLPHSGRSETDSGYDGMEGGNHLRGRKIYRNFTPNRFSLSSERSDQNRTIKDPEQPGATFTFSVAFEQFTPVELGALLWSLTLDGKGVQRVGLGKPLGLGSVEVRVDSLQLVDWKARYASLQDCGVTPEPNWRERFVTAFQQAAALRYATPKEKQAGNSSEQIFLSLPPIQDLLALLSKEQPPLPVHYPRSPETESKGQFEWFMGNKRKDGPKIELDLAAEDKGLPLINKRGERW